jgi:hypothetical protein
MLELVGGERVGRLSHVLGLEEGIEIRGEDVVVDCFLGCVLTPRPVMARHMAKKAMASAARCLNRSLSLSLSINSAASSAFMILSREMRPIAASCRTMPQPDGARMNIHRRRRQRRGSAIVKNREGFARER